MIRVGEKPIRKDDSSEVRHLNYRVLGVLIAWCSRYRRWTLETRNIVWENIPEGYSPT